MESPTKLLITSLYFVMIFLHSPKFTNHIQFFMPYGKAYPQLWKNMWIMYR